VNRHERRHARALNSKAWDDGVAYGSGRGPMPAGYAKTANATLAVAKAFVARTAPPPQFALLDRDIALGASLLDHGHTFARNASAHTLVDLWIAMTRELELEDGPTYMMLRAVVELLELPYDTVPLDELFPGAELRTMAGAPAGKS